MAAEGGPNEAMLGDGFPNVVIFRHDQDHGWQAVRRNGNIDETVTSFILVNSILYDFIGEEPEQTQLIQNLYHFFVSELGRDHFYQWVGWENMRRLNQEEAAARLADALGGNFSGQWTPRPPLPELVDNGQQETARRLLLFVINHLGRLYHRNPVSGWDRVENNAQAEAIIHREGYVKLLVVPGEFCGWFVTSNELYQGPIGRFAVPDDW